MSPAPAIPLSAWSENKEKRMSKTGKKNNLTESEMEVLHSEVEARKIVLFGMLSSGISSKRKKSGWESVCEAVNAVGSEKRTQAEVKEKWSNIKVDVKRRLAAHRRSVAKNQAALTPQFIWKHTKNYTDFHA